MSLVSPLLAVRRFGPRNVVRPIVSLLLSASRGSGSYEVEQTLFNLSVHLFIDLFTMLYGLKTSAAHVIIG